MAPARGRARCRFALWPCALGLLGLLASPPSSAAPEPPAENPQERTVTRAPGAEPGRRDPAAGAPEAPPVPGPQDRIAAPSQAPPSEPQAPPSEPQAPPSAPPVATPAPAPPSEPVTAEPEKPRASDQRKYLLDRLAAGASLGYFTADDAQILSGMHFDFPYLVLRQKSLYVRGNIETSTVRRSGMRGTDAFQAQSLEYLAETGVRDYLSNRVAIAAFLGVQGRHQLDGGSEAGAPVTTSMQYLGLGFESAGFPRPGGPARWEWRLAIGPVFSKKSVEGDFFLRGAAYYDIWRGGRSSVSLEAGFDSLFDGLDGQTEWRVGPSWNLPLQNGVRASFFANWIHGDNPLLLSGQEGWNFGVRYTEGVYAGPHTVTLPDVRGVLAFGRGEDRGFGRFDLDLSSPELTIFSRPGRVFGNLDANTIAGTGTDNIFYVARLGIDILATARLQTGLILYHRSNHTIGEEAEVPNNLNIVQFSAQTPGWDWSNRLPGRLSPGPGETWYERLEGTLVPGIVTGSTFTDAQSWDLQAGARFDILPRRHPLVPFVRAFAEWGEAIQREYSVGFTTRQNLVVELKYRKDSQLFGNDNTDLFLGLSLFF